MKKHILTLWDLDEVQANTIIKLALIYKRSKDEPVNDEDILYTKSIGLLFEKASTRTRIAFEVAINMLGGSAIYLNPKDTQISRNEPIKDTARILSAYLDAIIVRTYSQQMIEEMAKYSSVPVINALTDMYHPCQVLSDLMTIVEKFNTYKDLKIAWIGDGNNVANSWIAAAANFGFNLTLACPKNYMPTPEIIQKAQDSDKGNIYLTTDPIEAATDADIINTDVWASMGQESEADERKQIFQDYQVNASLVAHAKETVSIMHCLPAHRGEEITEDVLEGPKSNVWNQAENKMYLHKALLEWMFSGEDYAKILNIST